MRYGNYDGILSLSTVNIDASLAPAPRRPGSMDAHMLPSLMFGKRVHPERILTDEELHGLSCSGEGRERPADGAADT